jgi:hypothetical protein
LHGERVAADEERHVDRESLWSAARRGDRTLEAERRRGVGC